jgi:serine/threonine-protein kinase HipA
MSAVTSRREVKVCLGQASLELGTLVYTRQGQRQNSAFAYDQGWLHDPERFNISADLNLRPDYQYRRARSPHDSVFHGAIADTAPDAWGRRVIARDHAKRRREDPGLSALTEMDYLLAVDDFSRIGALRLRDDEHHYHRTVGEGRRSTPPLIELERIYHASRAVERGQETADDLRYLRGKGTSLGGMRPKCTILDEDGTLAIGKFPSVLDTRSVTRGEVLALQLAHRAGIDAAPARIVQLDNIPIAVITRFDRDAEHARIPYQSAASVLQASREEDRSYTEIALALRSIGYTPILDIQQLWRRLVFNLLITNVDDHLQNLGFLHMTHGQWRLAPAFDVNPFPDKDRESKTWLSEDDGPITDIGMLLARSGDFALNRQQALAILAQVHATVSDWRALARSSAVGLRAAELDDFAPAFEHEQMDAAADALR